MPDSQPSQTGTQTFTFTYSRLRLLVLQMTLVVRKTTGSTSIGDILKRGFENEWLETVSVHALDSDDKLWAQITMSIDWKLHKFHISQGSDEIAVNSNLPETEQLSVAIDELIKFFNELVDENKHRTEWVVNYSSKVTRENMEQVRKELGLVPAPIREWATGDIETAVNETPSVANESNFKLQVLIPKE